MDILIRIIGPAPSELNDQNLYAKLERERLRVQASLQKFKAIPQKIKKTANKTVVNSATAKKVVDVCKQLNITIEEFIQLRKKLKEKEE